VRWRRLIPSIALLVFFIVLWVRSYRVTDYPHADLNIVGTGMYSAAGGARFSVFVFGRDPRWAVRWEVLTATTYPNYSFSRGMLAKLGFGADTGGQDRWHYYGITFPYWFITVTLAALMAWTAIRRKPVAPGLCRHCGYDLRATPEQGGALLDRCPECGAPKDQPPSHLQPAGPV